MTLKIVVRWGDISISGLTKEYAKYERDLFRGKIPCPFKCEFKNADGMVVSTQPIPLTPAGKPKVDLF